MTMKQIGALSWAKHGLRTFFCTRQEPMKLEWGFQVYEDFHKFGDPRIRIKEILGV